MAGREAGVWSPSEGGYVATALYYLAEAADELTVGSRFYPVDDFRFGERFVRRSLQPEALDDRCVSRECICLVDEGCLREGNRRLSGATFRVDGNA
jgi:hypothetical protein